MNLLEFVDAQVLNGYDELVKTGVQYYTDATMIDDIVKDVLNCSIQTRESALALENAVSKLII